MVYKTIQGVSIPNLKLFGPVKAELWAKEVGEFSIMLWVNGLVGPPCLSTWLPQYKCIEIF